MFLNKNETLPTLPQGGFTLSPAEPNTWHHNWRTVQGDRGNDSCENRTGSRAGGGKVPRQTSRNNLEQEWKEKPCMASGDCPALGRREGLCAVRGPAGGHVSQAHGARAAGQH